MNSNKIIGIDLNEFESIIGKVVAKVLQEKKELFMKPKEVKSIKLLTREEACKYLRISSTTLWELCKEQLLKPKRIKSKIFFIQSELDAFILNKAA